MESLWLLIPISLGLVGIAISLFLWAVNHNQFNNLDHHAMDVLDDE